jgi:hypothetical protein
MAIVSAHPMERHISMLSPHAQSARYVHTKPEIRLAEMKPSTSDTPMTMFKRVSTRSRTLHANVAPATQTTSRITPAMIEP